VPQPAFTGLIAIMCRAADGPAPPLCGKVRGAPTSEITMSTNPDPFRVLLGGSARPPSLLGRIVATVGAVALFALAFTVSVFVLVGALALGLVAWGWFWWKTRELRRQIREQFDAAARAGQAGAGAPPGGTVIEGEVIVSEVERER